MPGKDELPGTLRRSPEKAKQRWAEVHDSAVQTYGEGERAHRVAIAAVKHGFEKVGDRWEPKDEPGPSDERVERGSREPGGRSAGGVDVRGHTKDELYERARELDVRGRSSMTKHELGQAIARKQG